MHEVRERLFIDTTTTVAGAGQAMFRQLRLLQRVVATGASLTSPAFHDVYHPYLAAVWTYRVAVRTELEGLPLSPDGAGPGPVVRAGPADLMQQGSGRGKPSVRQGSGRRHPVVQLRSGGRQSGPRAVHVGARHGAVGQVGRGSLVHTGVAPAGEHPVGVVVVEGDQTGAGQSPL